MIRRALPLNRGALGVSLPLLVILVMLLLPSHAATPVVRVSVATNGTQSDNHSTARAISVDGRYAVFTSLATNLVPGDTNGQSDIFLHDTVTHTTSRALLAAGAVRNVDDLFPLDVSADGRFVSFSSAAAGLVSGDTNGVTDVFVYDFTTQQTTRVSVASNGAQANGQSFSGSMSSDGRFIVFDSTATNLALPNNGPQNDIFLHDRVTHQTTQVSTGLNGAAANSFSVFPQISASGRFITFSSAASNLTAQADTNGIRDIFVLDRQTGVIERVTVGPGGVQANGHSLSGATSSDGRFVVYASSASNLVANDTNGLDDIFLYDRQSGQTKRISVSDTGAEGNGPSNFLNLSISANGRFISFSSIATSLGPVTPPGGGNFLYDRATAHIQLAIDDGGGFISVDGRWLVFSSGAGTFVPGDTNGVFDVFVTDLSSIEPVLPAIAIDHASLQFGATQSSGAFAQQTPAQRIRLTQSGAGTVTWTASATQPWITVSPPSGTGPVVFTVGTQFVPGLPLGASTGQVLISTNGAENTVGPVAVTLTTALNGASASPGGSFDTPTNGVTGVTGSIAVTGWSLDDIEVRAVHIVRDPVPGEGSALIFIGNAVFVEGARPDVAAALPTLPQNLRAGWGYLLLTNFLPNQGDGTYRLHAIAEDAEGHTTALGTKTITCANSTATRPFGAIDTPGQGEIISGAAYPNFGWVLARAPSLAFPPHGTVSVLVDGVLTTVPGGWASRPDLSQVFPAATYPGVTNALGVAGLDTTTLSNGVHTIAWIVTADNGETEGVGSRFFSVSNGGTAVSAAPGVRDASRSLTVSMPALLQPSRGVSARSELMASIGDEVAAAAADPAPIYVRTGFSRDEPFHAFAAGAPLIIYGEEMDRFEVRLSGVSSREQLTGYTRAGGELRPLPIGSNLDQGTGAFTWHPGPGFLGAYDLSFVRWTGEGKATRRDVRIVISPAARNRVGPQVIIDAPSANAVVRQPFMLGGWAADRDAAWGTGIETLHVWAYPVGRSGPPIFVGATAYGGARPDVAALLGERFRHSGYGMIVETLPPGTYDLAVFAWSTSASDFLPAKLVRVAVR